MSSYYLEDASYVKIDNLSIGYTFDVDKVKWLSKFRVYFVANNLYTFTKYSGLDPEVSNYFIAPGIDNRDKYPTIRSYTFGLSVNF